MKTMCFHNHIMILSYLLFALLIAIGRGDDYTCSDSSSLKAVVTQCSSVTWSVARLIDHNNTNENEYYPVVLDFDEQENRVTVCIFNMGHQLATLSLLSREYQFVNNV